MGATVGARRRRIVHVISTPTGVGGAEHVLRQVALAQEAAGDEVVVANPFCRSEDDITAAQRFYAPIRFEGRTTSGALQLPGAALWLRAFARRVRPHVVHCHLFHATALAGVVRWPGALRLVTHHHGALLQWRGRRAEDAVDRWATRRADAVVTVSQAVQEHVVQHCGVPRGRVRVIHNGWSGEPLPHRGSAGGATIVCVANLRPEKGHEVLLEAMARVRSSVPEARLVLLGDGARRAELAALATATGIADVVELRGRVDDVWTELAAADVFALASFQEPLGIAVLEAMAAGLPVVATAVGGVPEIVPAGAGVLVPPGDPVALADALLEVLRSPGLRADLVEGGRRAAGSRTSKAMVEGYITLYGELVPGAV